MSIVAQFRDLLRGARTRGYKFSRIRGQFLLCLYVQETFLNIQNSPPVIRKKHIIEDTIYLYNKDFS